MDVQIPPVFYRTLSPFGAEAQKRHETKAKYKEKEPVAQRQEMVSGTLALLRGLSRVAFHVSRALAPKGDEVL